MNEDQETASSVKAVVLRWFHEVWNGRNRELVYELMAPDAKGFLEGGTDVVGPEGFLGFQSAFLEAVPDLALEVVDCIAGPKEAYIQWKATGNHSGRGLGMEPTGKAIAFQGVTWFRVRNGKITEGRDFWNLEALMREMSSPAASEAES